MKKILFVSAGLILIIGLYFVFSPKQMIPEKAKPITQFEVNRYLGTWYEIARFDFYFEKDLDNTSAQYSLNADGSVHVLNSGFNVNEKEWKEANGKAKFREATTIGALKVSFFGPFYSGYNIIALDPSYKYALIAGKNLDYLWILSREKTIPEDIKKSYLALATEIGYDVSRLLWIKHDKDDNPFMK